jgi:hypothetical protein
MKKPGEQARFFDAANARGFQGKAGMVGSMPEPIASG